MEQLWIVALASVGLLVRVGLGMYACGLARSKNAGAVMARHVGDLCVATLAFFAVGHAIWMQHNNGFFGVDWSLCFGATAGVGGMWVGQLLMVLLASSVVIGTAGERSRWGGGMVVSAVMGGLIVPVGGHWAYEGFLFVHGYADLGGASVAHVAGAAGAMMMAVMVGARKGKFNRDGSSAGIPGHHVPMVMMGVLVAVAGWVPYLLAEGVGRGVPVEMIGINVLVAAAAAGVTAMGYGIWKYGKVDLLLLAIGILGGLVAVSAGANEVRPVWAMVIGGVAGVIAPVAALTMDLRMRIDDVNGGIAIHGVGGLVGMFGVGLLGAGGAKKIGIEMAGVAAIAALAAAVVGLVLMTMRKNLRAREGQEYDGLDLGEHDINAYPDFQQTMIKSYHNREV